MANELGDQLRHAREDRGLSFSAITAQTKIPIHALQDLEAEAFDRLPPGVFRRAYLRTYATLLGLDGDALVRAYADRWEPPPPMEPEPRLSSWSDERLRALLAVLASGGAIVGVLLLNLLWRATAPAAAPPMDRVAQTAAAAANATGPATSEASRQPLRLQIRTTAACWISATADDASAVRRLVNAGETISIAADSAIVLHLGDAGAVAVTINGERGRALGQRGQPVTVQITPKTYSSFLAQKS